MFVVLVLSDRMHFWLFFPSKGNEYMFDQKKQFTKVNQLCPVDAGLNLTMKVVNAKTIVQRGRIQGHFAECLVGGETGIIIFTTRNDQG